jgi:hypothetical protein
LPRTVATAWQRSTMKHAGIGIVIKREPVQCAGMSLANSSALAIGACFTRASVWRQVTIVLRQGHCLAPAVERVG